MIYRALAGVVMGAVLSSSKKEVMDMARNQILRSQMEGVRKATLAHVAEKYTEEVEYNLSQYIRALQESSVEIEFEGKPGEALIMRAESAVKELEGYIEAQNPDGAIIQFLKRRYKEEGVRIISGRLYASHYVNRKSQGVYEMTNKMGYAGAVDKRKPWLTARKTAEGVESIIADAATEIFEVMFDDVDLSSELAGLKFTGLGDEIAERSGSGFAAEGKAPSKPKKSSKKKKR